MVLIEAVTATVPSLTVIFELAAKPEPATVTVFIGFA